VDPRPVVAPKDWAKMQHRAVMLTGLSPGILTQVPAAAGGPIDFALIDGDHEEPGVIDDIEGVMPLLADDAYLLFHDAHYFGVADAIDGMVTKHHDSLIDCGMVSREETPEGRSVDGRPVVWGGLRLVRYCRSGIIIPAGIREGESMLQGSVGGQ
jgi:hypothetical protein